MKKPFDILPPDRQGRIPPHARELEDAVLGAMMLERDKINLVIHKLTIKHFYVPENQFVFEAIDYLYKNNKAVDLLTVNNYLKDSGKLELTGGAYYLAQLTNKVSSAVNIEFHTAILIQKYISREQIRIAGEMAELAFNDELDPFESVARFNTELITLVNSSLRKQINPFSRVFDTVLDEIYTPSLKDGLKCGFNELDELIGGFQPSDLIVLAARPGMGKTALIVAMMRHLGMAGIPSGFFSLEMSQEQIVKRMISAESGIYSTKFRSGHFNEFDLSAIENIDPYFKNLPIFIDDSAGSSLTEIQAKSRQMHQLGAKVIFVDYLQLIKSTSRSREQEVAEVSRGLKNIAKDLGIPVVALAQLNRGVEDRADKRPMLSDLRESGEIENSADVVTFLVRPEYYKIENFNFHGNHTSADGIGILDVQKNRHGATGDMLINFDKNLIKFYG
jgi:replicative DNA helicase